MNGEMLGSVGRCSPRQPCLFSAMVPGNLSLRYENVTVKHFKLGTLYFWL